MARSKENVRQNKAMQEILRGGTPERRVFVAMEDVGEKNARKLINKKERKEAEERTNALKEARMPWFCPKCDKVMKKNTDNKMWGLYGHCSECQVQFENRLTIDGKYDEWVAEVEKQNQLSWIKDQKESIEEFKKQEAPEFYQQFRPDGHSIEKEKWDIDKNHILRQADEALEYLQKMEDSLK